MTMPAPHHDFVNAFVNAFRRMAMGLGQDYFRRMAMGLGQDYEGPLENTNQGTVLSRYPDGLGFFYGHAPSGNRRIDVRCEEGKWVVAVDGDPIPLRAAPDTLAAAEAAALAFIKANPL